MSKLISKHDLISRSAMLDNSWWWQIAKKIKVETLQKYNSCVIIEPGSLINKNIPHICKFHYPVEDVVYSLKTYVKENQYIIFSCWIESFHSNILKFTNSVFIELLKTGKFSKDKLIILTGALPVKQNYDQYIKLCQINNWDVFPIIFYSGFENKMFNFITKKREFSNLEKNIDFENFFPKKTKNKLFLFLNGAARSYRTYLLLYFAKLNILDKFLYSYLTDKEYLVKNIEAASEDVFYKEKILSILPYIDNIELPKILTLKKEFIHGEALKIHDNDLKLYDDTYLSIISESTFYKYENINLKNSHHGHLDGLFLTEKTFRTIACKHPFIVISRPNTLKALRELGYKTYSPWIDESYDEIENDYDRLDKIIQIVNDLASKNSDFWDKFYQETKDIAQHNYNILYNNNNFPLRTAYYQLG